ncbi:MAG TPA: hypothetical protein VFA25_01770 [Actinomycetota bacterium]|jgi:hypothetical protein|nr:hypothetical protein [Actinomycetota bacterium]
MSKAKRGDRLAFLLVAAGLTIGHSLSYLIAIPDPGRRALVLHQTGHGYLHVLADLAMILATAALVTAALRTLGEGTVVRSEASRLAWRVGAVQVAAFLAIEVGERVASHAGFAELLADRILAIGVVVQLLIALLSVLVVRWITLATARLASVLASSGAPHVGTTRSLPIVAVSTPRSTLLDANGARAPPGS